MVEKKDDLKEKVLAVLLKAGKPLLAREIAGIVSRGQGIRIERHDVNAILYSAPMRRLVIRNSDYQWALREEKGAEKKTGSSRGDKPPEPGNTDFPRRAAVKPQKKIFTLPPFEEVELGFYRIQKHYFSCTIDRDCTALCLRNMKARKEPVGDREWFQNPPPDYLGERYAGIVVVVGNPAIPGKGDLNRKVRETALAFMQMPVMENARLMNRAMGAFISEIGIVKKGVFEYEKSRFPLNEIACLNAFKCHVRENEDVYGNPEILSLCAKKYLSEQMAVLRPRHVIYLGKTLHAAISKTGLAPGFGGQASFRSLRNGERIITESAGGG